MVQENWVQSLGWEDPIEKEMSNNTIFLPGEFHGQRSLVGYLWGHQELDTTEGLTGEGNGTPLQYSCLENPMDGGVW